MDPLIEEWYEHYSDSVYHYLLLHVHDRELAEDLTHDTFIRAMKHYATFRGESAPLTWLIQIARNLLFDHWRRKKLVRFLPFLKANDVKGTSTTEDLILQDEQVQFLHQCIAQLKPAYRDIIILRKIKQFSIKETAEILGWSESKVKLYTHRGMTQLKAIAVQGGGELHAAINE